MTSPKRPLLLLPRILFAAGGLACLGMGGCASLAPPGSAGATRAIHFVEPAVIGAGSPAFREVFGLYLRDALHTVGFQSADKTETGEEVAVRLLITPDEREANAWPGLIAWRCGAKSGLLRCTLASLAAGPELEALCRRVAWAVRKG